MKNACAKLKETTGGVLSLEQYDSLEEAIATCLCSIGYCLHRRKSSLVQGVDSNVKGGSSTSDWNSETTSFRQTISCLERYPFSLCFQKSARLVNKSNGTPSRSPGKELPPRSDNFERTHDGIHANNFVECGERKRNDKCKCNTTRCSCESDSKEKKFAEFKCSWGLFSRPHRCSLDITGEEACLFPSKAKNSGSARNGSRKGLENIEMRN